MSYQSHIANLLDPDHKFSCDRCFDTGNEGDIGFFIACKNGCSDSHHEWLDMDRYRRVAKENGWELVVHEGELLFKTGYFPKGLT